MCMYVCVCVCTCTCAFVQAYMRVYVCVCVCVCVHVCMFKCAQLKNYMESGKPLLKEVSLKLLERLLSLDTRVDLVAHMSVIHSIISLALDHTQQPSTQVLAFGVLDKVSHCVGHVR